MSGPGPPNSSFLGLAGPGDGARHACPDVEVYWSDAMRVAIAEKTYFVCDRCFVVIAINVNEYSIRFRRCGTYRILHFCSVRCRRESKR